MPARDTRVRARVEGLVLALAACSGEPAPEVGHAVQEDSASPWAIIDAIDFDGDGLADVLWSDPAAHRVAVFLMRGTHLVEPGAEIIGPPGSAMVDVTGQDFNRDGMADLPWFDASSGRAAVWLMRGTHVIEAGPPIPGPEGKDWALAYAADVDGDGMADLLWHDPVGARFAVWLMRGTHVVARGPVLPAPEGEGWTVPSLQDFNLDGTADILWFNTRTQRSAVWLMRATAVLERGAEIPGPPGSDWRIITTADFDHDGMADVLWSSPAESRAAVWLMRATHLRERGLPFTGPPGAGWIVGTAGDTDGDGMADVVWHHPARNRFTVWTMQGTHVSERGAEIPGPP